MIPQVIHQTYKTKELPLRLKKYQEKLLGLHSGWKYYLWDDQDNAELLQKYYPALYECYQRLPLKIMKVDFIRYVYLYHYGGLYLDLDYELLKPFDFLDYSLVLPMETDSKRDFRLGNALLASVARHPFWEKVLEEINCRCLDLSVFIEEDDVIDLSGPGLVTKVYLKYFNNDPLIFLPARNFFNPPRPRNLQEYVKLVETKQTYGIHHCEGSWRALTKVARLKRKFKKIFFKLITKK